MEKQLKGQFKAADGTYRIVASTDGKDRDGERVLASSFKNLKTYLSDNPVILWAHDYHEPPIGRAVGAKAGEKDLQLDIEFASTPFAQEIKSLYETGFMNSFSIGFIPKNWDRDKDGALTFTDVELLEVSAVPVPANAAANIVRQAKSKGMELVEFQKHITTEDSKETGDGTGDSSVKANVQTFTHKILSHVRRRK